MPLSSQETHKTEDQDAKKNRKGNNYHKQNIGGETYGYKNPQRPTTGVGSYSQ